VPKKWSIFGATAFAILLGNKTFDFNFICPEYRCVDSAVRALLANHRERSRRVGRNTSFIGCFLNFFSSPDLTISTAGGRSIFFRNEFTFNKSSISSHRNAKRRSYLASYQSKLLFLQSQVRIGFIALMPRYLTDMRLGA